MGMICTEARLKNGERVTQQRLRLTELTSGPHQLTEVAVVDRDLRIVFAELCFVNGKRSAHQWHRLLDPVSGSQQQGKIVKATCDGMMIEPELDLTQCDGTSLEPLRSRVECFCIKQCAKLAHHLTCRLGNTSGICTLCHHFGMWHQRIEVLPVPHVARVAGIERSVHPAQRLGQPG